ncbi:MAG: Coenzyme F420 hydrogenase/dehydrogenase, beta subunit C-terminal domain [Thermodesulfobacteriota bacterium]
MKTFFHLVQEVQKPGLCHRCGGCVTFCTAINYGALELNADGKPQYADMEKCIECGLCYAICPEINEFEEETKRLVAWSAPLGRVIETSVVRARDEEVRERATDGGAVTALLVHLFDTGRIDGAVVTRPINPFQREPFLALTRQEILDSAGFHIDTSHGMKRFSDRYLTYASIEELQPVLSKGLRRVAFVGTPCQIKAVRKMQAMEIVPSEAIAYCLGLFCSGNFIFGPEQRTQMAELGGFSWDEVVKMNIKDSFQVHLTSGEVLSIDLDQLEFMKRVACRYCPDYTAEYADLSFGGLGAEEGWTTVLTRTPLGRAILADARGETLEEFDRKANPQYATQAFKAALTWSEHKKAAAAESRQELGRPNVRLKG